MIVGLWNRDEKHAVKAVAIVVIYQSIIYDIQDIKYLC